MYIRGDWGSKERMQAALAVARGEAKADTVIKGARFLDVFRGGFVPGDVAIVDGIIVGTGESYEGNTVVDAAGSYLVPGFIDAHVHIESSMMTPARFEEAVLPLGTTTAIWDPHEIANVWGRDGIRWALAASEDRHLDFLVMVPSCVPSTPPELELETSGAELGPADLAPFRDHPRVLGLAEMMNFPGVVHGADDVLEKLTLFRAGPRDGHCPLLTGKELNAYAAMGIHSCHESTTIEEAREKLTKGIHVLVREGSCAKDARTLLGIIDSYSSAVVGLCSDDRNPYDIAEEGHLNFPINLGLKAGQRPEDLFRAASFAVARAYGLGDRGAVAPGFKADLVLVRPNADDDFKTGVRIESVWKAGRSVTDLKLGDASIDFAVPKQRNINMAPLTADALAVYATGQNARVRVIGVRPGQILTDAEEAELSCRDGQAIADPERDILKIVVAERHHATGRVGVGFVRGMGLRAGAIATSINHDSHNIIAVGASDELIRAAIASIVSIDGGIVVQQAADRYESLALPIGGLMTHAAPPEVAATLARLKGAARELGCELEEPFLTLSFLALPVIPSLKITDRGLVDVTKFAKVPVVSGAL